MLYKSLLFSILLWLLSACSSPTSPPQQIPLQGNAQQAAQLVLTQAQHLQQAPSAAALQTFTQSFAQQGVRFAPYYYLESTNRILTNQQFITEWSASPSLTKQWGIKDGGEEGVDQSIKLTLADYLKQYVLDFPYSTQATVTLIQTQNDFKSSGNLINNVLTTYPPAQYQVVEYHQAGIDPQYGGMDWTSLMVVLERQNNQQWALAALIHGSWTI